MYIYPPFLPQVLLKYGACIDAKNDQNLTPLHLAAQHGKSKIVEMLLRENYNIVNDEDDASNTPLHLAALEVKNEYSRFVL